MRKNFVTILLLYLTTFGYALPVQSLDQLFKELDSLSPLARMVRASKHLDTLLINNVPFPQVKQHIDSLLVYSKEMKDHELESYLLFYDQIKKGLYPIAHEDIVEVFSAAIDYFKKGGNDKYAGISHYYLGQHYYEKRKYGDAFYHHTQAKKLFYEVGMANIIDVGKYLHSMALSYYNFGYYDNAIELMRVAINIPAFNENLDIQRYNTLGMAYQQLNKLDSAIYYFKLTQKVAATLHDTTWVKIAAGNLGGTYTKNGQYKQALPLLIQDYQYNKHRNREPQLARNAALNLAKVWQKLGRQDSTLHYARVSERLNTVTRKKETIWELQKDEQLTMVYYDVLHEYYRHRGNSAMAYFYLDSLHDLRGKINQRYNKMTKQLAEDRLTIEQQYAHLAVQEIEKKRIRTRLQFIVGIVGLLAAMISILYYMLRLRYAKDKLLTEKENITRQVARERTAAQLTEANLKLKQYMLRLQEKKNLVQTFQTELEQLRPNTITQASQMDELTSRLVDMKLLTLDDWNDFRYRFNQAFGGQLDQLKMQYGNLTHAEERIYALEKLNVSTGQIAWMLGISPESVRKTRYRLRKKIGTEI
jgi:DNA-binding CsgD family transcriptional regulator/tetratricopeptide (TPR) repeat protein